MKNVFSFLFGRRGDWHLSMPWIRSPKLSLHWFGPLAIVGSVVGSWFAFDGITGLSSSSAFSMWIGAVSILLMAWSFILALRVKVFEKFWGGLDSMYRGHRWAGALAIPAMYLHTSIEPETKGAQLVAGASNGVADAAEELAETGQTMLYVLIGISLLRLIPYRWWRWTHKLFGIPFAFASWHFYTAMKPYDNASAWGLFFNAFMVGGLGAYIWRILVRDTVAQGKDYTVTDVEHVGTLTRVELEPKGKPLGHEAGQFAFLRFGAKGMSEPHPFTIASGPSKSNLEFYIRHLGDWSDRLPDTELLGARVRVEGPYGEFEPLSHTHDRTVWIAGGVGITPFLAALDEMSPMGQHPPTVLYACKTTEGDLIVDLLRNAHDEGTIDLHLFASGNRLTTSTLDELFPSGMANHHVALCGPEQLVRDMARGAAERGSTSIETEDFDIRQGFGPDRSREIAALTSSRTKVLVGARTSNTDAPVDAASQLTQADTLTESSTL